MKQVAFLLFLGAIFYLSSCGRVESDLSGEVYDLEEFYPLGKYEWTYRADSVIYDLVGNEQTVDSTTTYIRYRMEKVDEYWLMIEAQRPDTLSEWKVSDNTQIRIENGSVIMNQNGQSLIAIKSPIRQGTIWEESALVDPQFMLVVAGEFIAPFSIPWQAEFTEVTEGVQLGSNRFDRVLRKVSVDEDVLIERRSRSEWYAAGYGLVQARGFFADTQCEHLPGELADCIDLPWQRKANRGFQYVLTLESFEIW